MIFTLIGPHSFSAVFDDPLRNGVTARGLGMGSAFVAVADDSSSPVLNPAGLVSLKRPQATGMFYNRVFGNYYYAIANSAYPTEYGTFGVGGVFSGIDNITVTVPTTMTASSQDKVVFFSYASNLRRYLNLGRITRRIYFGANLKLYEKTFPDYNASGVNLDLGFKYTPNRWFTLGISKQNILGGSLTWNTGHQDIYPSPLFIGTATRIKLFDNDQVIALDAEFPSVRKHPPLFHLGTEYEVTDNFVFRGGFDQMVGATSDKLYWNLALGLGLYTGQGFIIDYAYHPYYGDPTNVAHFISISYVGEKIKTGKGKIGSLRNIPEFDDDELEGS